ncbi:hypothetical protein GCM10011517_25460 [Actibacterium pelagium]|uniref:Regulatory protein SoxS n=2 Tax=Actibacterium pelagium TaxID=2029103 RepID=A0A917AIW5_9RHOB|nr:hypothetical protein [Actibacterium pelagium]GGE56606.1 hypothetical protein GCM10011517_25460 [Actibacterium pelagium]
MIRKISALLFLWVASATFSTAGTELVMVEEPGCVYCMRWNTEVGPIYPKTPEGQAAPLRRIDLTESLPADLSFRSRPVFTPTFVLMRDGQEVSRIEGYMGDNLFWGMLGMMFEQNSVHRSGG